MHIIISGIINEIISYALTLIRSRCRSFSKLYPHLKATCDIPNEEIVYVASQAFLCALSPRRFKWIKSQLLRRLNVKPNLDENFIDL